MRAVRAPAGCLVSRSAAASRHPPHTRRRGEPVELAALAWTVLTRGLGSAAPWPGGDRSAPSPPRPARRGSTSRAGPRTTRDDLLVGLLKLSQVSKALRALVRRLVPHRVAPAPRRSSSVERGRLEAGGSCAGTVRPHRRNTPRTRAQNRVKRCGRAGKRWRGQASERCRLRLARDTASASRKWPSIGGPFARRSNDVTPALG